MAKFTGRRVSVGIAKEATHGGAAVAAQYWIPRTAITFDDRVRKALVAGSYGNISDAPMTAYVVHKYGEGNLEGEININSFGLLLLAVLGTEVASAGSPEVGVNTHNYTLLNTNQHPSLTIHVSDPIGNVQFRLAMINSLTIEVTPGEIVRYTANFVSRGSGVSSETVTWVTDTRFTSPNLTFKVGTNKDTVLVGTAIKLRSLTLEIAKNVEQLEVLGSFGPEDILNKGLRISGSLELTYEDRTWRDYMLNGTARAMWIKLESTKNISANYKAKLEFVFPKIHFDAWESLRGLDDISSQTINFEVMLDISTDPARLWSTCQIYNTAASSNY